MQSLHWCLCKRQTIFTEYLSPRKHLVNLANAKVHGWIRYANHSTNTNWAAPHFGFMCLLVALPLEGTLDCFDHPVLPQWWPVLYSDLNDTNTWNFLEWALLKWVKSLKRNWLSKQTQCNVKQFTAQHNWQKMAYLRANGPVYCNGQGDNIYNPVLMALSFLFFGGVLY